MPIDPSTTAVVLIEYQNDFTSDGGVLHGAVEEVMNKTGMLDNTSQVHCNQWMIDQQPERYVGGQLIVFGGIPFNLCLGISSADVADNALADLRYATGRHTAPVFAGDTVFASTEIRAARDLPGRPDLGVLDTVLRGHKFGPKAATAEKVDIFYLERELVVKRRSHYA